jgi:hypothetical protein
LGSGIQNPERKYAWVLCLCELVRSGRICPTLH